MSQNGFSPVTQWLKDLRFACDNECLSVLQGKSLTNRSGDHKSLTDQNTDVKSMADHDEDVHITASRSVIGQINAIRSCHDVLKANIDCLMCAMNEKKQNAAKDLVGQVLIHVDLLISCVLSANGDSDISTLQCDRLQDSCARLVNHVQTHTAFNLYALSQLVDQLVDTILTRLLQTIMVGIDLSSPAILRSSICQLIAVCLQSESLCRIAVKLDAVERLVDLCYYKHQSQQCCISLDGSYTSDWRLSIISSSTHIEVLSNIESDSNQSTVSFSEHPARNLSISSARSQASLNGKRFSSLQASDQEESSLRVDCSSQAKAKQLEELRSNKLDRSNRSSVASRFKDHTYVNGYIECSQAVDDEMMMLSRDSIASGAAIISQALRALATICCVPESLLRLDMAGGVACLCVILRSPSLPQSARAEAAGVLAQITSPALAECQPMMDLLENMGDIVAALTGLCRKAASQDAFLLACAALSNLTTSDSLACDYLTLCDTLTAVIAGCNADLARTVFARDQVMTIIANMAANKSHGPPLPPCRDVTEWIAIFLNETTSRRHLASIHELKYALFAKKTNAGYSNVAAVVDRIEDGVTSRSVGDGVTSRLVALTPVELAACERMQQRAAMTISRLSSTRDAALAFIDLNCVARLVELCTEPEARNHSDSVLISCLTALRKLYTVCGPTCHPVLTADSVRELIRSDVMQSFLRCSTAIESFI